MDQEIINKFSEFREQYQNQSQLNGIENFVKKYITNSEAPVASDNDKYSWYYQLSKEFIQKQESLDIYFAAKFGYEQYMLQNFSHTEINQANSDGMYPLHIAALHGNVNVVNALLSLHANPGVENVRKQLPIHCTLFCPIEINAQQKHDKEIIFSTLITAFPESAFTKDKIGNNIFHYMAMYGFNKLLTICLKHNAAGLFINNNLRRYPIHEAIVNNKIDVVRLMLQVDGVINLSASMQRKPLHYAAMYGYTEVIKLCCDKTDDLNIKTDEGKTALMIAVEANNLDAIKELLARGVNINLTDNEGRTALHYACINQNNQALQELLGMGDLNKNIKDIHNKQAIDYCESESIEQLFTHLSPDVKKYK